ncbi:histidine phosphatase family protein [Acidicapsa ligni]|uniref:histidine phosphatase family protein n=1 Tax=Acidicapsa ligni TaxID=542300 RepID=UPI0021E0E7CA|nr:histidine phosphatase family protein [Acidicapsa ligni]
MKWPKELLLIRHAESAYNILKAKKEADPEYLRFRELFDTNRLNPVTQALGLVLNERYWLGISDRDTPLTPRGIEQARTTGRKMRESEAHCPEIIFVSPYFRTKETLRHIIEEWPELAGARVIEDERIREQDHGLALLYSDWRIYQVMNPDQGKLHTLLGDYDYRYLNGENIPDVRLRNLSWIATLIREFAGKRVLTMTHHLTILATRANFERLSPERFKDLDENEKPVTCGVTRYIGNPDAGTQGKLELKEYNRKHY